VRNKQKKVKKEKKKEDSYSAYYDINLRNETRKERQAEKIESDRRQEEYNKMRQKWREDDERKSRERAADERKERENVWARADLNRKLLAREKEEARKELEQREEQRAYENDIREKRWQAQQERDYSTEQDLDRILSLQRREKMRFAKRNEFAPTGVSVSRSDFKDLDSNSRFRETYRAKGHTSARLKRIKGDEESMDNLKRWYNNRDLDRAERNHRAIKQIYS